MKKLLVLHFKGGVSVSGTGSGCGSRVVASLERDNVGAIVQRGLRAEGGAIQRQRGTGTVKDLYADVSRAARGGVPYHWVDALLAGKSKRVLHVLQQLRLEGSEPAILLRTLQRELLLLVNLKRQSAHTPLRSLFDKHRVWQNRRQLVSDALARLSADQLRQAVTLLTRAELTFKQDYGHSVWPELESLSLLLCHKALADVFIDG